MFVLIGLSSAALVLGTMAGYLLYTTMTRATMTAMERMQLEEEERGLRHSSHGRGGWDDSNVNKSYH